MLDAKEPFLPAAIIVELILIIEVSSTGEEVPFIRFETSGGGVKRSLREKQKGGRKMLKQRLSLEMKLSRSTLPFECPNVAVVSNNNGRVVATVPNNSILSSDMQKTRYTL